MKLNASQSKSSFLWKIRPETKSCLYEKSGSKWSEVYIKVSSNETKFQLNFYRQLGFQYYGHLIEMNQNLVPNILWNIRLQIMPRFYW